MTGKTCLVANPTDCFPGFEAFFLLEGESRAEINKGSPAGFLAKLYFFAECFYLYPIF